MQDSGAPRYIEIANALEQDIRSGVLKAGVKLPTLKELAASLGVTPGTISRAYELAQRKGLVEGEVGRGTFVRAVEVPRTAAAHAVSPAPAPPNEWADLSLIKPNVALQEAALRDALEQLAKSPRLSEVMDYTPDGGHPVHRQEGAEWLRTAGVDARWEQVVLTAGAQHGLWVAVSALTRPGDLVVCESLCYPGIASVVHSLGRRLRGVAMDGQGMRADALREACREERPAMLICVATCQNPTAAVMSGARRHEIAALAREFDFIVVDDDLYGFLAPEKLAPLATFAPERSLYLTSLSKAVMPTLRLGYIHAPVEWLPRLTASVRTSIWMVSPLAAQLGTQLISAGVAGDLARAQRDEARARQGMVSEVLAGFEYQAQPSGFHLWLKLPGAWSSGEQFAALARANKLLVASGEQFACQRGADDGAYVRIAIMAGSREDMRFGLAKLAGLLRTADPRLL